MTYNILAREVMTLKPVTTSPEKTVYLTLKKMVKYNVGSILVVDKKNNLLGVFTEKDIMKRILLAGKDPKKTKIKDVMTKRVITIGPWEDISEIITLFNEKKIRRIPVVDGKKLVGVISRGDIMAAFGKKGFQIE